MQAPTPIAFSIRALNRATDSQAAAIMDRIVERSAWLAHRAAEARPFSDVDHLACWLETEVRSLARDEAVMLLCAHPELVPPAPSEMTEASQSEQGRFSLLDPGPKLALRFSDLNRRYLRRHGYPFVIALHAHHDLGEVLAQFESRIAAKDPEEELARSLGEVVLVMKARLARLAGAHPAHPEISAKAPPVISEGGTKP